MRTTPLSTFITDNLWIFELEMLLSIFCDETPSLESSISRYAGFSLDAKTGASCWIYKLVTLFEDDIWDRSCSTTLYAFYPWTSKLVPKSDSRAFWGLTFDPDTCDLSWSAIGAGLDTP